MVLSCQLGAHLLLQPRGTPTLGDPMAGGCSPWDNPQPSSTANVQVCTAPVVGDRLSPPELCRQCQHPLGLGAAFWGRAGWAGSDPAIPPPSLTTVRACSGVSGVQFLAVL